jgi:trimeric autotransporter adhesin
MTFMKKFLLVIFALASINSFSQFNYSVANTVNSSGTYTDLGTNGTAITTNFAGAAMTFDDDNSSIQNIGFNFVYNGTTFTQFVLNTNGFIRLGNLSTANADSYDVTQATTISNIIAPFNFDLIGAATPEYRVYTSGAAGSRVTTIQWKNVVDYNATPANAQFANLQFQVKLYETTNKIEFIYGTFTASAAAPAFISIAIGIMGTNTVTNSVVATKASSQAWTATTFLAGGYGGTSATVNYHNVRNSVLPDAGRTYTFTAALPNDLQLVEVYSLSKYPTAYNSSKTVSASVKNIGTNTMTNVTVTLTVTGANPYTNTQNIASIAAGASATVTFTAFPTSTPGTDNITVSLPSDDNNANNSKTTTLVSTYKTFSYSPNSTSTGSLGYNTGSGLILNKYTVTGTGYLRNVAVYIPTGSSATGNTVYGVVLDAAGTIIGQSANYIVQASDLNTWVNFVITTPPSVSNQSFFVGLAQTANAVTGYFPVGTQTESPARSGAFYTAALAGGVAPTEQTTFGRFMIEAGLESTLPVSLVSFTGKRENTINLLSWTTSTESNNKGFELERSADGKNFSSIGFVATKGADGNSVSTLNYNFNDERALAGTNYYRLKQVDKDGKFTYSSTVVLKGEKSLLISALYPNPAKDQVNMVVSSERNAKANITVTDLSGKIVLQVNTTLTSGDNNINFNVSAFSKGTYYVRLTSDEEVRTTQFMKN